MSNIETQNEEDQSEIESQAQSQDDYPNQEQNQQGLEEQQQQEISQEDQHPLEYPTPDTYAHHHHDPHQFYHEQQQYEEQQCHVHPGEGPIDMSVAAGHCCTPYANPCGDANPKQTGKIINGKRVSTIALYLPITNHLIPNVSASGLINTNVSMFGEW